MNKIAKFDFFERVDRGIKQGVADALDTHRRRGEKVAIWRDGRVVEVLPSKIRQKKRRPGKLSPLL
jgi:hypothetical protein